jgi:hypothetical protein
MARIGLRMMPPFDRPPKIPDSEFSSVRLQGRSIGPSRRLRDISRRAVASALRALRPLPVVSSVGSGTRCADAPPFKRLGPLHPGGPRSGPGFLSGSSSVTRPHAPDSPAHPDFTDNGLYAIPSRCVRNIPRTPGRPTSGFVLSWSVPCRDVIA